MSRQNSTSSMASGSGLPISSDAMRASASERWSNNVASRSAAWARCSIGTADHSSKAAAPAVSDSSIVWSVAMSKRSTTSPFIGLTDWYGGWGCVAVMLSPRVSGLSGFVVAAAVRRGDHVDQFGIASAGEVYDVVGFGLLLQSVD